jgi:hypothetical protein
VYDPATLIVAFDQVVGNLGARTPGVDGLTVADIGEQIGVPGFLDDLRAQLKAGMFRPLPAWERNIPKPSGSGKIRKLGIPHEGGMAPYRPMVLWVSSLSPTPAEKGNGVLIDPDSEYQ